MGIALIEHNIRLIQKDKLFGVFRVLIDKNESVCCGILFVMSVIVEHVVLPPPPPLRWYDGKISGGFNMQRATICRRHAQWLCLRLDSSCLVRYTPLAVWAPCMSGWLRQCRVCRQKATPTIGGLGTAMSPDTTTVDTHSVDTYEAMKFSAEGDGNDEHHPPQCVAMRKCYDQIEAVVAKIKALKIENVKLSKETQTEVRRDELESQMKRLVVKLDNLSSELNNKNLVTDWASWSLDNFLQYGLQCHLRLPLHKCPAWKAFCRLMPSNVSNFLETVKRTETDCVQRYASSDDDYRMLMANVVGSLIKTHTLDTFRERFSRYESETTKHIEHIVQLLDEQDNKCCLLNVTQRCATFDLVVSFPDSVLKLVNHTLIVKRESSVYEVNSSVHEVNPTFSFRIIEADSWTIFWKLYLRAKPPMNAHIDSSLMLDDGTSIVDSTKGLVLVSGARGSGKTLTALMSAGTGGVAWLTTAEILFNREALTGETCDKAVAEAIVKYIKARSQVIATKFKGKFVLVIDDAGDRLMLVQSLCRIHRKVSAEVALLLQLDENMTHIIVCGTGVERISGAPGLTTSSYQVINMSNPNIESEFFKEFTLKRIASQRNLPDLAKILCPREGDPLGRLHRHPAVLKYRRLLQNRSMAVIFLLQLEQLQLESSSDESVWLLFLMATMPRVIVKQHIRVNIHTDDEIVNATYASALAMCLGGPFQYKALDAAVVGSEDWSLENLFSVTGLFDNRVAADDASLLSLEAVVETADEQCTRVTATEGKAGAAEPLTEMRYYGLPSHSQPVQAVLQHGMRCYSMSAATVEGGLCALAGAIPDATGFEHSVANIALLWMHALTSHVPIDLTLPDDLLKRFGGDEDLLRDVQCAFAFLELLRWTGGVESSMHQHVAHIQLQDPVTSAGEAWVTAQRQATEAQRGDVVRTVVVNGSKSAFGDVIVIAGRKGAVAPLRCLVIRTKHHLEVGEATASCIADATRVDSKRARGMQLKSLVLCRIPSATTSTHECGASWHAMVLNDRTLSIALHPVELGEFATEQRPEAVPPVLRVAQESSATYSYWCRRCHEPPPHRDEWYM